MPRCRPFSPALVLLLFLPASAVLALDTAGLCDRAAVAAAGETGAPLPVLLALTRTETGRRVGGETRPWPWAVNRGGAGAWHASRAEAVAAVEAVLQDGATNIDIGCFQLNHHWHGGAFASVDAMFDPAANALYAARFLLALQKETGDWRLATGAFHSRRPEAAASYLDRFDSVFAALAYPDALEDLPVAPVALRVNSYPLLAGGAGGGAGSLMPDTAVVAAFLAGAGAVRPLIGP